MVAKRGNCYCVLHGHAKIEGSETDKPKGARIKCYCAPADGTLEQCRRKAEAMHRAILISESKNP
jgi:hypothetical protein